MKGNSMRKRLLASIVAAGLTAGMVLAAPAMAAETNLKGAGSSFANKYITQCAVKNSSYSVAYGSVGSGAGRTAFANGSVAFGASDAASAIASGWSGSRSSYTSANDKWTYIPVVGGPISVLYNVPGVASGKLKLDSLTLAKILAGKITKWNDSAIKALQDSAVKSKLPAKPIRVVYRATNSGTSENLTNYLRQTAPSVWTRPKNGTIAQGNPAGRMPAGSVGAANSQALVTSVKSMKYTIGYADLSDAVDAAGKPKVSVATLKNANGEYVAPSSAAASKFLESFYSRKYFNSVSGAVNLDFTAKVAGAYNMSLITYAIADKGAGSQDVENFINYLLNDCGTQFASSLGYSPITGQLKTNAQKLVDAIKS
jgi:phosphate transport system substrate-binding protein